MNAQLAIPNDRIAAFCRRWRITELALFGSILREDFGPESDVDVLVSFAQDAKHTLFDLARMETELGGILGREVDLVDRAAVERSRNYIRRKAILSSLEPIYAA
jgi:predicted nucleotidyltransferase